MSGVQKCQVDFAKSEPLYMPHAVALLEKWFGVTPEAWEAKVGRYSKGKHKGELRGSIVWRKVRVGGWCYSMGGVLRPGMTFAYLASSFEEYGQLSNLEIGTFVRGGTRVDSDYGFSPEADRAARAANIAGIIEHDRKVKEDAAAEVANYQEIGRLYALAVTDEERANLFLRLFVAARGTFWDCRGCGERNGLDTAKCVKCGQFIHIAVPVAEPVNQ